MKAKAGIKTIAMKVNAADFGEKKWMAQHVLSATEVYTEPGLSVFQLPDGCLLELYGPGASCPDFLFRDNATVLSFRVQNIEEAIKNAKRAGMEILSGIQKLGTCISYCYLRDKEGMVFGLVTQ